MKKIVTLFLLMICVQTISYSQITITPLNITGGCGNWAGCNGSATFSITGGSTPYTYTFTSGATAYDSLGNFSIYNLCSGTHTLIASDQSLSTSSYTFSIVQSPPITAVITTTNSNCSTPCVGAYNIIGSGGVPPYLYAAINPLTMNPIAITTLPMTNLCSGIHKLYITDNNGCQQFFDIPIMANPTLSGVTASLNATNSSCINSFDGSINLSMSGSNTGPFTYLWSPNNQTTQNISGGPGAYMVTIYDANMNCLTLADTINSTAGYCGTIRGNIFIDNNSDCIKNIGEINCSSAGVTANPGNRIGYTNFQGNYFITNLPYGTYTLTPNNYANSVVGTCTTTIIVNVTSPNSPNHNFPAGYTSLTQPDVQVNVYSNGIVPGFNCNLNYSLCNLNNVPTNGFYKALLPTGYISTITSITPATYTISGDTIIWPYNNITSTGGCQNFTVSFTPPISTPLGSIFTTCISTIN